MFTTDENEIGTHYIYLNGSLNGSLGRNRCHDQSCLCEVIPRMREELKISHWFSISEGRVLL